MHKRGNVEVFIFLAVALVALGGVVLFMIPNSATGQAYVPVQSVIYYSQTPSHAYSESAISGGFVIPAAKEYGGSISGVSVPGTRAFPAGRAVEVPDQSCYTCSCMDQGITSTTREAAEKVCRDNCGGDIVSIVVGQCD